MWFLTRLHMPFQLCRKLLLPHLWQLLFLWTNLFSYQDQVVPAVAAPSVPVPGMPWDGMDALHWLPQLGPGQWLLLTTSIWIFLMRIKIRPGQEFLQMAYCSGCVCFNTILSQEWPGSSQFTQLYPFQNNPFIEVNEDFVWQFQRLDSLKTLYQWLLLMPATLSAVHSIQKHSGLFL